MRSVVLAGLLLALALAGCGSPAAKDGNEAGDDSRSSTSTTGGTNSTEPALPFVDVKDNMVLHLAVPGTGAVHRLRLVAFDDFTIDDAAADNEPQGGGGGGGGGAAAPRRYGFALLAPNATPGNVTACSDAAEGIVWDGRARSGDPNFNNVTKGVYDLWVWSSAGEGISLDLNDGGNTQVNATPVAYDWSVSEITAQVTNSGPAQTVATFTQAVTVPDGGGLLLGRFSLPNGYPTEEARTKIEAGSTCAETVRNGGGGGGFGGEGLSVGAFLGKGEATWSGTYTAALAPQGGGSAAGILLTKA